MFVTPGSSIAISLGRPQQGGKGSYKRYRRQVLRMELHSRGCLCALSPLEMICVSCAYNDQLIVGMYHVPQCVPYPRICCFLGQPAGPAPGHTSTPRKVLPKAGDQCKVGETSLDMLPRLPESAPAPLESSEHSCLEFQPDLRKQLLCEVRGCAEAGRPLLLPSGHQGLWLHCLACSGVGLCAILNA